jgi:hypothetical protein
LQIKINQQAQNYDQSRDDFIKWARDDIHQKNKEIEKISSNLEESNQTSNQISKELNVIK